MSFGNLGVRVYFFRKRSRPDNTRITSESHIPSFCSEILLMMHNMDDIMISLWSEFFTRCIQDSESISSKFDCHNLRSETDSEKWDLVCSCIFCCLYHSKSSTSSESTRYTDSIESLQEAGSFFFDIFRIDEFEFYFFPMCESCTLESLIERIVGIFEIRIFPNHTNCDDIFRVFDIFDQ